MSSDKDKRKYHSSSEDDEPEAPPVRGKAPDPKQKKAKKDKPKKSKEETEAEADMDVGEEAREDAQTAAAGEDDEGAEDTAEKPKKKKEKKEKKDKQKREADASTSLEHEGEYETLSTDHLGLPRNKKGGHQKEAKSRGRAYTVSLAVPGSIIDQSKSWELKTNVVGQIARACVIFNVDEIVVFRDKSKAKFFGNSIQGVPSANAGGEGEGESREEGGESGDKGKSKVDVDMFVSHVLQYLDCPPYLRKALFPMHRDLKFASLPPPLMAPHHVRLHTRSEYREGITVASSGGGSGRVNMVDCGLLKEVQVDKMLPPGLRVTVKLDPSQQNDKRVRQVVGKIVSPSEPRTNGIGYWGYNVRLAESLSDVLTGCPYPDGYDVTIATSAHAQPLDTQKPIKPFKHMLVVFGGPNGLDACVESDEKLEVDDVSLLFDMNINTCPGQGTGSIRTEEAVFITMSALRPHIQAKGCKK